MTGGLEETKRFHRQSERYDWIDDPRVLSAVYHRRRAKDTIDMVRRHWQGGAVLDVGTGTGLIAQGLREARCIGIDINRWAVGRAAEHCPDSSFVVADAEDLPFRACSCRTVICTEVLEHSPCPSRILDEIMRVLEPGGVLVGSVPSRSPLWKLRRVLSSRRDWLERAHANFSWAELTLLLRPFETIETGLRAYGLVVAFAARKPV